MRVIRSMYDGAMTTAQSGQGKTSAFEIKVGVQGGPKKTRPLCYIASNFRNIA